MRCSKPQVFLLCGDELAFHQDIEAFAEYVTDKVRVPNAQVRLLYGESASNVSRHLANTVTRAQRRSEPVVFVYSGHGNEEGIYPREDGLLYTSLAEQFRGVEFLCVNSSCQSGEMIGVFKAAKLLPKKGSVIAHVKKENAGVSDGFVSDFLTTLSQHRPYRKRCVESDPETWVRNTAGIAASDFDNFPESTYVTELREILTALESKRLALGPFTYRPTRCGKMLDHLLFPDPK